MVVHHWASGSSVLAFASLKAKIIATSLGHCHKHTSKLLQHSCLFNTSLSLSRSDTIQRRKIWAISLTYTTAHGNTGSTTQWASPGREPKSSWILAGFGSAVPQWELPETQVYILLDSHSYSFSLGMHSCSYSPSLSLKKKKKKGKKKEKKGFPSLLSVLWPTSMRTQVWALSLSSGLRIQRCHELCCRSQMWLWSCIAVAVVWAGRYSSNLTPSLRTSICCEYGPGKKKKQQTNIYTYFLFKIYMF